MNFEQMEYIVNVAKEKSITKAADKLFISPSGMSQSITQLENELGVKIFNRAKQGVTLTFEGEIVISKAIKLLNTINELNNEIKDFKNSNQNHLKIVTAPTFTFLLQETMLKFNLANHDATFEIIEQNPADIVQNFNKENYDFALIHAALEDLKKEKNIRYEHIYKGHVCIAVGKNSPFYNCEYVTPNDLVNNSKLLMYNTSDYKKILKLPKLNFDQVFLKSNRSSILFELVKESEAFLYLHDFSINNRPMVLKGEIKVIPLKDEEFIPIDFWLIYLETKELKEVAKAFISEFCNKLKSITK